MLKKSVWELKTTTHQAKAPLAALQHEIFPQTFRPPHGKALRLTAQKQKATLLTSQSVI